MTIDIDAIRERERVILPGPWRVGEMVPTGPDLWQLPILLDREGPDGPDTIEVCAVEYETGGFHYPHADAKADAEFIAHARTDVPALLARVDELERAHQLQQRDLLGTIAERDALMPVVESAKVWREWYGNTNPSYASACNDLAAAMDRLTVEGGA